jgi:hypothetical protein
MVVAERQPKEKTTMSLPAFLVLLVALVMGEASAYSPSSASSRSSELVSSSTTRRQWFSNGIVATTAAFGLTLPVVRPAEAAATDVALKTFDDPTAGFSVRVPERWTFAEQMLSDRRRFLTWVDPDDATTLVYIAYTPVRDDFTSLGSFGSVDQVAAQTILPKGKLMEENSEVTAKMLSAVSKNQAYVFDYLQEVPPMQPLTHYRTIFTLKPGATGGAGAVLVTVTAQTPEARYSSVKPLLDAVMDSYDKSLS